MTTRKLATMPAVRDESQLADLTRARFPKATGCNVVGSDYAVYFNDTDNPPTADVTAWQAAVAAHVPSAPSAVEVARSGAPDRLRTSYSTLRTWADDARVVGNLPSGTNVTQAQHKTLFTRFGSLCDGLADLLLLLRVDQ